MAIGGVGANLVETIGQAFAARGGESYGEDVSQLSHALQCALIAAEHGAEDHLVAAALLHDYGHLFEGRGDTAAQPGIDGRHEAQGARALARWFGAEVVKPISLHVAAKRYLCATEPGYENGLSAASVLSLKLQGGRLTPAQCRRFEMSRFTADAVRLRRWDDEGKLPDRATPGLETYWPLLVRLAKP